MQRTTLAAAESASGGLLVTPLTSRSRTTTKDGVMSKGKMAPDHPGEILNEEFLKPMDLSQNALARKLGVPPRRINEIIQGKAAANSRYGSASWPLFRCVRGVLDGASNGLRVRCGSDRLGVRLENEVQQYEQTS